MNITATTPPSSAASPGDRRSAWYAATKRRLDLTEDAWYDPAVEHVLEALARDEPIREAVTELGNARGHAGFDLRETATDLDALAEVVPEEIAHRLRDELTVTALSAWADAFIDRAHPPACVDAMTGLATVAYLRVRLAEVHRECDTRARRPADDYALVVTGPLEPPPTPLARLAAHLRAGRCLRDWFPGGETACHLDGERVAVLAPNDDRLPPRARGLAYDLAGSGPALVHIEPLADRLEETTSRFERFLAVPRSHPS